MKTIAIDNSAILIASLATFMTGKLIKNKVNPLSDPEDVEMFSDIMISRLSATLCDIADPGDRVVLCIDKKDEHSQYWRHHLANRVASVYKLNRDKSLFANVNTEGLNDAKNKYMNWCNDNGITQLVLEGFEADDIIAELVSRAEYAIIISPDGDFNQLINSPTKLRIDPIRWKAYRCMTDESDWFGTSNTVWADAILKTLEITDVALINSNYSLLEKILMGDKSDGIPSVHTYTTKTGKTQGVGKATAEKMIKTVFSAINEVKHYNDLTDSEKRTMCSVLKNPDVNEVLTRMKENADMIILHNTNMLESIRPVSLMVDALDENNENIFKGVESTSVRNASDVIIKTIETPEMFNDYEFND